MTNLTLSLVPNLSEFTYYSENQNPTYYSKNNAIIMSTPNEFWGGESRRKGHIGTQYIIITYSKFVQVLNYVWLIKIK